MTQEHKNKRVVNVSNRLPERAKDELIKVIKGRMRMFYALSVEEQTKVNLDRAIPVEELQLILFFYLEHGHCRDELEYYSDRSN